MICKITSTTVVKRFSSDLYITVFYPISTFTLATYTANPSYCRSYTESNKLQVSTNPVTTWTDIDSSSWLQMVDTTTFTLYTNSYAKAGTTAQIRQVLTYPFTTLETYTTAIVHFLDPCWQTAFVTQTLTGVYALIGAGAKASTTMPKLEDTINNQYGSDPADSICGDQGVSTLKEGTTTPSYLTLIVQGDGTNVLYISTNNASLAGSHTVNVKISLTKYSNITATAPITVDLFTLVPTANLTNYTYKVNSNPLTFRVPLSYLSPYGSASFTFDHRAQIPGGAPLPSHIQWKEAG